MLKLVLIFTVFVVFQSLFSVFSTKSSKGRLTLHHLSVSNVNGTYLEYEGSAVGIKFSSSNDHLSIVSLDGTTLLIASEAVGWYRWINVGTDTFIQKKTHLRGRNTYKDCALTHTNAQDRVNSTIEQLFHKCDVDSNDHEGSLQASVNSLLGKPEISLLQEAVKIMGRDFGITGRDYPSVLPLYLTTLSLHRFSQINLTSSADGIADRGHMGYKIRKIEDTDCLDECPPCPDDLCLGMCGYSCSCWSWVCGDCCYHLGCYGHDVCCREKFVQTKCLLPFSFECEEPYDC